MGSLSLLRWNKAGTRALVVHFFGPARSSGGAFPLPTEGSYRAWRTLLKSRDAPSICVLPLVEASCHRSLAEERGCQYLVPESETGAGGEADFLFRDFHSLGRSWHAAAREERNH